MANLGQNLTNPELRNLNNWEVLYHPPKFTHGPVCTTFFKSHQCNFREDIFSDYENSYSEEEVVENDTVDQALNNFKNELENFQYEFELTIL